MKKYRALLLLTMTFLCGGLLSLATGAPEEADGSRPSPSIDITAAVAIAAQYVTNNNIDISRYFLASAIYQVSSLSKPSHKGDGPYWQITYESNRQIKGGYFVVLVYMDKTVDISYGE